MSPLDISSVLADPFALAREAKQASLMNALDELVEFHRRQCGEYANILACLYSDRPALVREEIPFLPVRLFKSMDLRSTEEAEIVKVLHSSGTTGQVVSRIHLDRETARRQTLALASIFTSFFGKERRPMMVVDSRRIVDDRRTFSARAAGILGFANFGRQHYYCLDDNLALDVDGLTRFLEAQRGVPLFVFGFTAVVWHRLFLAAETAGLTFDFGPDSFLVHGGGWKQLKDKQVDNHRFREGLRQRFGIGRAVNYYGMAEQVGSIFLECEQGYLHTPDFADVIVRDRYSLAPLPPGEEGLIQVLSSLPLSYPGHSLLTEDLGVLLGEDDCPCGRKGRYFSVSGRLPEAELRGCSDVRRMP